MTLEIPTELEAKLQRAAQARGTDARTLLLEAARRLVEGAPAVTEQSESEIQKAQNAETKRLAAVNRLHGYLAKSDFAVDEFLRERSAEGRKEAGL